MYISSNGFLTFSSSQSNGCCSGQSLPSSSSPNNLIALAWEDLNPYGNSSKIRYSTIGSPPNRQFRCSYLNIDHHSSGNQVTAMVILYETSNIIEVHLQSMPSDGGLHTEGIENVNGTVAYPVPGRNRTSWSAFNSSHRWVPQSSSPVSRTVTVIAHNSSISCPSNTTVFSNRGNCGSTVNYPAPTVTDNCSGGATGTQVAGLPSGSLFPIGTTANTFRYTDGGGNTVNCSFNITVNDNVNPTITCPANTTVNNDPGNCNAVVNYSVTSTDNCPNQTVTRTAGQASGTAFPIGVTTNSFTVTDVSGNSANCSFNVTVNDNEAPTITCPANITVNNDPGQCGAEVCYELPFVDDNCAKTDPMAGFTFLGTYGSHSYYVSNSASTFNNIAVPAGGYLATINDAGENAFLASNTNYAFWIGGNDVASEGTFIWATGEPFCYSNWGSSEPNNSGGNEDYIHFTGSASGTWNDIGSGANYRYVVEFGPIPTLVSGIGSEGTFPGGTTTETYTVSDASGNSANCSFTVTVTDNVNPTITCPANITVNNDPGNCDAVVNYSVTSSDNCPNQTVAQTAGQASGTAFPTGAITNSFTVTDPSGNTANCSFTVTVNDNEDLIITCPADITVPSNPGQCGAEVCYELPFADDNCAQTDPIAGFTFLGTYGLHSYYVSNSASTYNNITVPAGGYLATINDAGENAFLASATPNALLWLGGGDAANEGTFTWATGEPLCYSNWASGEPNNSGGNEDYINFNLGSKGLWNDGNPSASLRYIVEFGPIPTLVSGIGSEGTFPVGITTETYTVSDASGNTANCSFTVTVSDNENPVAVCPATPPVVTLDGSGNGTLAANSGASGLSADNCTVASEAHPAVPVTCADVGVGVAAYTLTATDPSGNVDVVSCGIDVQDNIAPAALCQGVTVILDGGGNGSITSSDVNNGSNDACGIASLSITPTTFNCSNVGNNSVTLTVTDNNGNSSSCTSLVTVSDNENPVAVCPAIPPVVTLAGSGNGTLAANSGTSGLSTDNCSVASETHPAVSVTCADVGVGVAAYTLTATDPSGNVDVVSCGIDVQDNIAPAALCQGVTVILDGGGNGSITASDVDNGSNDACGIGSLSVTPNTFNCSNVGNNSVTLTVTDINGNSSTCNSSVTVVDNELPTIVCPADTTIPADTSSCSAVFSFSPPPASDNCAVANLWSDWASGSTFPTFVTPITWYVADVNGNIDSCTFNLNVEPEPFSIVSMTSSAYSCGHGVSCYGSTDGFAAVAFKGGCEPYSISWNTGDTSLIATNLGAGFYTVTVTDGLGTVVTNSVTLTEPDLLSLSDNSDTLVCQGDSTGAIDLTVTGGNNCLSYSYNWSNGATTEDLQNLIPGTYSVTVTDVSGCSAATSVDIISLPVPVVNLGNDTTVCSGTPVSLSPGSQYSTYDWNNGDTAQSIIAGSPGLYTVAVTDIFDCPVSDSVLVSYFQTDDTLINPRTLPPACIGDTNYLNADPGYVHYLWSTGDVAQRIAFTEIGGFVTVLVTDTNGCRSSDSVFVDFFNTPKPAPVITPGPVIDICAGDSVTLNVLEGYFRYDWNTGDTTQTILVDSNGRYFVTVDNGFGCTGTSDTVFVTGYPIPNPVIFRQNDTLFVNGLFSSYQWYENRELIPGAISSHYVPLNANWYSIGIIDSNGCTGLSDFLYYNPSVSAEGSTESILGIEIFPNPTSGMLNVRAIKPIDWDVDVTVMDMYGHVVKTFRLDHLLDAVRLDLRDVTNGMYLLRLEDSKGRSAMVRFMVE